MMMLRAIIAFWLALGSIAYAAEPFTRAAVEDKGRIVPGQQVRITVEIFVPDFFTSPPQFPLFDLPDAIVTLSGERAQNMVETIDGVQYSGIRRTYAVVPEAAGTFTLPPAVITLGYSQDGKPVSGQAVLQQVSFTVAGTPDGATPTLIFAARDLTISQSFDRDPSALTVGDAVVRTITLFAEDTQAMMIPAIPVLATKGFKQYSKSPQIADGVAGEGRTTGSTRTDTITYIAEAAGAFEIPAVSYPWFDIDTQANEVATLPATPVKVAPSVPAATELAPRLAQDHHGTQTWLSKRVVLLVAAAIVGLLAAGYAMFRLLPRIGRKVLALRDVRRSSEPRKFKLLIGSIQSDNPVAIYRHLDDWVRSAGYGSIAVWVSAAADEGVSRQTGKLESELFGAERDHPAFDRAAFTQAVLTWRKKARKPERTLPASPLPELNPHSGLRAVNRTAGRAG
ncbi:BatD family protein [Pararhizobium sp. DWP3-4]|uniref:BatD family protein n=1 Tax=Pararhizobium sp. DWP3-4 TaxID=2804565 RepID=UPI003CEB732C